MAFSNVLLFDKVKYSLSKLRRMKQFIAQLFATMAQLAKISLYLQYNLKFRILGFSGSNKILNFCSALTFMKSYRCTFRQVF